LIVLRSLTGPQGPLKPEFWKEAPPEPCKPIRATRSF
jgi:hypothetical protein